MRGGARPGKLLRSRMSSIQPAQITSIYRYPVKGLSSQPPPSVALARNSSSSTIASPSWRPISTKPAAIAILSCGGEMEALRTERASAKLAKSADKTLREAQAETIESSGETLVQENHNRLRRERQQATREIRVAAIKTDTSIFRYSVRAKRVEGVQRRGERYRGNTCLRRAEL